MKIKPYSILLLPLFFELHVVNSYYGLTGYSIILQFLMYYLVGAFFVFISGQLYFANFYKSGVWTIALLIIFFFFGSAHDFMKSLLPGSFAVSYTFLVPFIGVSILIISLVIKHSHKNFTAATKYLNTLFLILVILEIASLLYKISTGANRENNLSRSNAPVVENLKLKSSLKPDIFFMVFDEYASSKSLKKYFNYDNYRLDSILRHHNFFIASNSKSNYNSTPFSISSTFNLDYFNKPLLAEQLTTKLRLQGVRAVTSSLLPKFLLQNGYRILNYGLFDLPAQPAKFRYFADNDIKRAFYGETLWGRFQKDILWNVDSLFGTTQTEKQNKDIFNENLKNFKQVLSELKAQTDTPKFVFLHIMMPHSPFVVDSTGKQINTNDNIKTPESISLYISQLKYTNTWISALANEANKNFKRPRVIIIEGDHGLRTLDSHNMGNDDYNFMNLNSYFFSDSDYRLLHDSISPVNSFRVVLNKYFGFQIPILKDSTILLN